MRGEDAYRLIAMAFVRTVSTVGGRSVANAMLTGAVTLAAVHKQASVNKFL